MKIAISGKSGLIGVALSELLEAHGHELFGITRSTSHPSQHRIVWDYERSFIEKEKLEGVHALVHLAGENIASGPWTPQKKRKIYESRVTGTKFLMKSLQELSDPPSTIICASAIGIYGSRGEETLRESSAAGNGFLASVTRDWENAAREYVPKGSRLVLPRIGLVLSPKGGLLAKLKIPFSLGLGGKLGSGTQFMSWIMLEDLCEAFRFLLNSNIEGAVNMVSPEPVRNVEFTSALGRVLKRPTFLNVPQFVLDFLPGEMGKELLLASQRVVPEVITERGYEFRFDSLDSALQVCL